MQLLCNGTIHLFFDVNWPGNEAIAKLNNGEFFFHAMVATLTLKGHPPTNTRLGISTPYGSIPVTGALTADAAEGGGGGGGGGG